MTTTDEVTLGAQEFREVLSLVHQMTDAQLNALAGEMRARRDGLAREQAMNFRVGDKVAFTSSVRPAYLQGAWATIRRVNQKKVVVELDTPIGRFHRGITAPASMLVKR